MIDQKDVYEGNYCGADIEDLLDEIKKLKESLYYKSQIVADMETLLERIE